MPVTTFSSPFEDDGSFKKNTSENNHDYSSAPKKSNSYSNSFSDNKKSVTKDSHNPNPHKSKKVVPQPNTKTNKFSNDKNQTPDAQTNIWKELKRQPLNPFGPKPAPNTKFNQQRINNNFNDRRGDYFGEPNDGGKNDYFGKPDEGNTKGPFQS